MIAATKRARNKSLQLCLVGGCKERRQWDIWVGSYSGETATVFCERHAMVWHHSPQKSAYSALAGVSPDVVRLKQFYLQEWLDKVSLALPVAK